MTFDMVLGLIVGNYQARVLIALVLANLLLGVGEAIAHGAFDLTQLTAWTRTRLLPVVVVYAVGALISAAAPRDPILGSLRDLVFATESATLVALLLGSLRDLGIPIPTTLAGPRVPSGVAFLGGTSWTGGSSGVAAATVVIDTGPRPPPQG